MQDYKTRVMDEDVLRGNAAILKCILPSFVADFIQVIGWVADDGQEFVLSSTSEKRNGIVDWEIMKTTKWPAHSSISMTIVSSKYLFIHSFEVWIHVGASWEKLMTY